MFKKILFATSATAASDHAARVAFNIAGAYGSELNIFHVLGVPSRGFSQEVVDVKTREKVDVDDDYKAYVLEEIRAYYEAYLDEGFSYSIDVAVGVPAREILRQAKVSAPDLILLGDTTGEDAVHSRNAASSTLQKVARSAPCPVLVVNRPAASFWGGLSTIVFGTDFSRTSDRAFEFAVTLAGNLDCELHVFHALDITPQAGRIPLTQDEIEQQIRESLRKIRSRYEPRLKTLKRYAMEVWEGIPYVEIVKYSRDKHADLIVMAHHSRRNVSDDGDLGGNVEQVIVRAGCPVISINK